MVLAGERIIVVSFFTDVFCTIGAGADLIHFKCVTGKVGWAWGLPLGVFTGWGWSRAFTLAKLLGHVIGCVGRDVGCR